MAFQEENLYIETSTLPGAGKGLYTKILIPKGTRIVEYKGKLLTWKEVQKMAEIRNGYVFFFTNKHVIDAWQHEGFAHIANDAKGIIRVKGLANNSQYVTEKKRCFIDATRDIHPNSEIFVGYGAEYWQAIRYNLRLEKKRQSHKGASNTKLPHEVNG